MEKILNTLADHKPQSGRHRFDTDHVFRMRSVLRQVRWRKSENARRKLTRVAKASNITMILVGHVTKEGRIGWATRVGAYRRYGFVF